MGSCKYCGKSAGLFSNVHKQCEIAYRAQFANHDLISNSTKNSQKEWLPTDKISLREALKLIADHEGCQALLDIKLTNSLSDIVNFSDCPASKSVIRELLYNSALTWILNESDVESLKHHITVTRQRALNEFGFNENVINYVIDAYSYALGLKPIITDNHTDVKIEDIEETPANPSSVSDSTLTSHLSFWGIELGEQFDRIKEMLEKHGYRESQYNNPKEKKIHFVAYGYTEQFLGYGTGITIYISPYSNKVYRVQIYLSNTFKKTFDIYSEVVSLLCQKYGRPKRKDSLTDGNIKEGKGTYFEMDEGVISLLFGAGTRMGFPLYLTYEDTRLKGQISDELVRYTAEMKREKDIEEQNYRNKLLNDI